MCSLHLSTEPERSEWRGREARRPLQRDKENEKRREMFALGGEVEHEERWQLWEGVCSNSARALLSPCSVSPLSDFLTSASENLHIRLGADSGGPGHQGTNQASKAIGNREPSAPLQIEEIRWLRGKDPAAEVALSIVVLHGERLTSPMMAPARRRPTTSAKL